MKILPRILPLTYLIMWIACESIFPRTAVQAGRCLWEKGGRDLATHPDGCLTTLTSFLPTNAQWTRDSLSLDAYKGLSPVKLRFEAVSGWGNNLFLDDIEVDTVRRNNYSFEGSDPAG
ncbi:MAG: hypothetical protein KatS3mg026_1347 [Bacteroidia bacterium]|nr:MAG: hypothetical protein KatS3mg026_1347 [Bacteroidia bacterium]